MPFADDFARYVMNHAKAQPQLQQLRRAALDPKDREKNIQDLFKSKEQLNKIIPDHMHAKALGFILENQSVFMLHMTMRCAVMFFMALMGNDRDVLAKVSAETAAVTDKLSNTAEKFRKDMQREVAHSFREAHLKQALALCGKLNAIAKQVKAAGRDIKALQLEKSRRDLLEAMNAYMDDSACRHLL